MTGEAGPPAGDDGERRERMLASLLDATQELMVAPDAEAIAEVAVDAARDRLGYELVGVLLLPDAPREHDTAEAGETDVAAELVPLAWTDALVDLIGTEPPPTLGPGNGVAWESFESGDLRVFDDLQAADVELMDPETAFRSELHVPLGRHGILIVGSAEVDEFDAEDVHFARLLAANTTAALDNLAAHRAVERREHELARQNRRLEEFAGVVSHDLRNPLSVAKGQLELGIEDSDPAALEAAHDALDRMDTLIDGLLALAREGRSVGETAPIDVITVAERAWASVGTGDTALVTEPVPELRADADRLQQLLENLFRNAVEHGSTGSRPGGDDAVEHAAEGDGALTVTAGPLTDGAGFYVADDGPGIPPEERDEVFEHGVSTADGAGLGLTIVRTIAEAHGWTVAATESETGGARFEFRVAED